MSILSLNFIIFALVVGAIYFMLPAKVQWMWLLLASVVFFCINCGWVLTLVMAAIILVNHRLALIISDAQDDVFKKRMLMGIIAIDFALLYFFKDGEFLHNTINGIAGIFGTQLPVPRWKIAAPMGISYFMIMIMGYLADVYWGAYKAQKNIGKFALFVMFFPIMTSGPFLRYKEMEAELWPAEKKSFNYDNFMFGMQRIFWGLLKKMVISERIGVMVNTVFSDYADYPGLYMPFVAIMYYMQLYTDFSGLMDIMLGYGEILGIKMPENFDCPFFSTSVAEFWRRWHITLGGYLRDYVLNPLLRSEWCRKLKKYCKNRFGKNYEKKCNIPLFLCMFITWFLVGFWHGGEWHYIIGVGLYMWALMVLGELTKPLCKKVIAMLHINTENFLWKFWQRIRTLCLVSVGIFFFRAEGLIEGLEMAKYAFKDFNPGIFFDGSIIELASSTEDVYIIIAGLILVFVVDLLHFKGIKIRQMTAKRNVVIRWAAYLALFWVVILLGCFGPEYDTSHFIYADF